MRGGRERRSLSVRISGVRRATAMEACQRLRKQGTRCRASGLRCERHQREDVRAFHLGYLCGVSGRTAALFVIAPSMLVGEGTKPMDFGVSAGDSRKVWAVPLTHCSQLLGS